MDYRLTQCKHKPIKTCNCIFVAAWLIFMWTRADIQSYHTLHPPRNRHIGSHHITQFPLLSSILGPAVRVLPQTRTMTCFFVSPSTPSPFLMISDVKKLHNRSLLSPSSKNRTIVICFCHISSSSLLLRPRDWGQWLIQKRPFKCIFLYHTWTMWSRQKKGSRVSAVEIEHIWMSPLRTCIVLQKYISEHLFFSEITCTHTVGWLNTLHNSPLTGTVQVTSVNHLLSPCSLSQLAALQSLTCLSYFGQTFPLFCTRLSSCRHCFPHRLV